MHPFHGKSIAQSDSKIKTATGKNTLHIQKISSHFYHHQKTALQMHPRPSFFKELS